MTVVTIAQAQKALTRLIASANKGEDIIITKGKTPVARLIGVKTSTRKRVAGA
jgi:prevent-host-death family protein